MCSSTRRLVQSDREQLGSARRSFIRAETQRLEKWHWLDQHESRWLRPCCWPELRSRQREYERRPLPMTIAIPASSPRPHRAPPQRILIIAYPTRTMAIRTHTAACTTSIPCRPTVRVTLTAT